MERSRCWCRCRCRWMPLSGLARSGRVWSGLVWADYWPHGRHALFGRAVCNCAPSAASWLCGTHTHTHTLMRPTQPHNTVSSGHVQAPEKKTTANCPFAYGFWLVVFLFSQLAQLVIFIFISALGVFESWKCSQIFAQIYVAFVQTVCLLDDYATLILTRL